MTKEDLDRLVGEWLGIGEMTIGPTKAYITEHVTVDTTDVAERVVYTRHSRIETERGTVDHHEVGYTGLTDLSLLLSRGSYVRLLWDEKEKLFRQVASTPDTRNMQRMIIFTNGHEMVWDARMEVFSKEHNQWADHSILTNFKLVGVRI